MGPLESDISIENLLEAPSRQKGKMALFFVVVMVLVIAATAVMSPRYESASKLFVRLGRENVGLDATATVGQGPAMVVPASREDEINSVVELLNSRVLAEQLVDAFGPSALLGRPLGPGERIAARGAPAHTLDMPTRAQLERARAIWVARAASVDAAPRVQLAGLPLEVGSSLSPGAGLWDRLSPFDSVGAREQAIERVRRRLKAWAQRKSNIITVAYQGRTPEFAQVVVQKLVDLFLENHVRMNRTAGSRGFFESQASETQARLHRAEAALRDLKDATGLTSVAEQRKILVDRIGGLEDQVLSTEAALAVAVSEVQAVAARLGTVPEMLVTERSSGMANEAADGMRQQLYELQLREQELLAKYTEAMPAVQQIRLQIAEAQQIFSREETNRTQVTAGRNPAYEALHLALLTAQSEVASQKARLDSSRRQLTDATSGLTKLNEDGMRLAQLQRALDLEDDNYRRYAANLEHVRIDQALETERISNISVVQPATLVEKPVRPRKLFNYALGLMFATFGSLGLAVVAEVIDRRRYV